jgi:anaerobic magnesium-protoporphyrin IX monomethyl ester cyclase
MSRLDCVIIGHNEPAFADIERHLRKSGTSSCGYRDLALNFVARDGEALTLGALLRTIHAREPSLVRPIGFFDMFSATIAYLGTYLHRRGYTFDYVLSFRDEQARLEELLRSRPRAVAVTTTYYVTPEPLVEVVATIRRLCPETTIVVGGPFVANQVRALDRETLHYLLLEIDADVYVNSAQGERTLTRILDALRAGTSLASVDNVLFCADGDLHCAHASVEQNDLGQNWVDWRLFAPRVGKYAHVRSAISCPFTCEFCSFPELAGGYRTMTPEILERELDELARIGVLGVQFIDDTFNVPKPRFNELLERMIAKRYPFRWFGNFRCQFADPASVRLMRKSGCRVVFLGLEAGSDTILRAMNKSATVADYRRGIAFLRDEGIITFGSFILGFPGETAATIAETVEFLQTSGLDFFRINLWFCDWITPVWRHRDRHDLIGQGFAWRHRTMTSDEACDHVERLFAERATPSWVPIHDFDIGGVWELVESGIDQARIGHMLATFNAAVVAGRSALPGRSRFGIERSIAACLRAGTAGALRFSM